MRLLRVRQYKGLALSRAAEVLVHGLFLLLLNIDGLQPLTNIVGLPGPIALWLIDFVLI